MYKNQFKIGMGLGVVLLGMQAYAAPVELPFWYSLAGSKDILQKQIATFNAIQGNYKIVPKLVGNYREAELKLMASLRAGEPPVLFQAENSFFNQLAADGVLVDLNPQIKNLDDDIIKDFYSAVWNYGEVKGKRYGLPWNVSIPVLYYNTNVFKSKGVKPPKTYAEFVQVANKITNRGSKGFIAVADAWQFEQMVAARGGQVVTAEGKPNFDSPEVVAALEMLVKMSKEGNAIPRSIGEAPFAILDFVRTKGFMAIASIANRSDLENYSVAFKVGTAPLPCAKECGVPLGGAQLVVPKGISAAEQAGAVAFWKFLTEPKNMENWVENTDYLPARKSVVPLLKDYYQADPSRAALLKQLEISFNRPRAAGYATWKLYLEEAIERAIKGQVGAVQALKEAQKKALSK